MKKQLYYNTITPLMLEILQKLMQAEEFRPFRLVGGTSLSLQLGHRQSIDLDLFTDFEYSSVDFKSINDFLANNFPYFESSTIELVGMGKSCFIGSNAFNSIKLDLFYTDRFIRPFFFVDGLRLSSLDDIAAMKIDVITRGGRKKDFWDIHELLNTYSVDQMIHLHEERYPYSHDLASIIKNLTNFDRADDDFDPICLKHKYWELIKLYITDALKNNNF